MEPFHGTRKASKFASEDIINSMPKDVITNILDRLPIQDAVKTGILSRNWRFNWTMLTQLVFDEKFFVYLLGTKSETLFYRRTLGRILLHLKGAITKFILYIPKKKYNVVDIEDLNHWILFLSTKGMKEFVLINMHKTPLKLPTHLSSCLELKHLELHNCCFHPAPSFRGFPSLLSFNFHMVIFESCTFGEFISRCTLLEILKINSHSFIGKVKPIEIAKLENLRMLSLSLCELANMAITSSGIFQLMGSLPKLEELVLDFQKCKFLAEAGARKRVPAALCSLKTLTLYGIDFNNRVMVLCAFDLICGSLNLQTLKITATQEDRVSPPQVDHVSPPPLCSWEIDCAIVGKRQLRIVELECIGDSEIELCLIKSLLRYSPLLKKMVIHHRIAWLSAGCHENYYTFSRKLLKLHRASSIAEIDLC